MDSRKVIMKKWLWSILLSSCFVFVQDAVCCGVRITRMRDDDMEKIWHHCFGVSVDDKGNRHEDPYHDVSFGEPFHRAYCQQFDEKKWKERTFGPQVSRKKRWKDHRNEVARCAITQKNQKFSRKTNNRIQQPRR